MSLRAVCFVDMPFGKKSDFASGVEVDLDQVYEAGIEPAILKAGLEPIRGDRELTGGKSGEHVRLAPTDTIVC